METKEEGDLKDVKHILSKRSIHGHVTKFEVLEGVEMELKSVKHLQKDGVGEISPRRKLQKGKLTASLDFLWSESWKEKDTKKGGFLKDQRMSPEVEGMVEGLRYC